MRRSGAGSPEMMCGGKPRPSSGAERGPIGRVNGPGCHVCAHVHEWLTRRNLENSVGHLSEFYLRDAGLTKADVEAACTGSFGRSDSRAVESAAQNRMSNW